MDRYSVQHICFTPAQFAPWPRSAAGALVVLAMSGCWWIPDPVYGDVEPDSGKVDSGGGDSAISDTAVSDTAISDTAISDTAVDDSGGDESGLPDTGGDVVPTYDGPFGVKFVAVAAGVFDMGTPEWESDSAFADEPYHPVTLTHDIWISQYEITQSEWEAVMGTSPWTGHTDCTEPTCPASYLVWSDAARFANAVSTAAGLSPCYYTDGSLGVGNPYVCTGYRLPTDAEWEYVARAGTGQTYIYAGSNDITAVGYASGWDAPQPVGQLAPNAWGTYDMSGNLWEWTNDAYDDDATYTDAAVTDPVGGNFTTQRVARGGAAGTTLDNCRVANRLSYQAAPSSPKSIGFRLARSLN